ncbi:protocadherin gamma-C3-like [Salvelinus sp. IW2-2015]|uniref:protocadherin gamma-C3-like n=1 Tax=Salvelinus sp. IW2-2015 TaxID=2691554 RepID=UPI0038D3889A
MAGHRIVQPCKRYVSVFLLFSAALNTVYAVTHYSVPEEMEEGSVIANLASDLGLNTNSLSKRKMRLDVIANKKYLDVNKETGELYIVERLDRESLCTTKTATSCFLKMDATIENPIRMFNIELEIMDINDNAPHFRRDTMDLDISESTPVGERFSLNNAVDPDVGSNTVKTYHLSESEHFNIEIQTGRDGAKFADLILKKALDREQQAVHNLILTAVDGGVPARSGTANIIVRVLDTNDNAPKFNKDTYKIDIMENSPIGSLVVKLNATDFDEGTNSEITYSYSLYTSEKTQGTFSLNANNGEITVKEMINYEDFRIYDMEVIATDKGANSLSSQCKLTILVTDMNDNHPEMSIKSFLSPIKENVAIDTVIAVVSVSDKDSGENGIVNIHIADQLPFALRESSDNYFELVVSQPLDREKVPEYDITFTVTDRGSPPLSDNETMTLELLDVNDNVPHLFLAETRKGKLVVRQPVPKAGSRYIVSSLPRSTGLTETSDSAASTLQVPEYDITFTVTDRGSPTLSDNETMTLELLDVNDNVPQFPQSFYTIPVMENNALGLAKFPQAAFDPDLHENHSNVTVHIIIVGPERHTTTGHSVSVARATAPWVGGKRSPDPPDKGSLVSKVIAIDRTGGQGSRIMAGEFHSIPQFLQSVSSGDEERKAGSQTACAKGGLQIHCVQSTKEHGPDRDQRLSGLYSAGKKYNAYWYSLFLAETRKGKLFVRQPVRKAGSRYIVSSSLQ